MKASNNCQSLQKTVDFNDKFYHQEPVGCHGLLYIEYQCKCIIGHNIYYGHLLCICQFRSTCMYNEWLQWIPLSLQISITKHATEVQLKVRDLSVRPLWQTSHLRQLLLSVGFHQIGLLLAFNGTPRNK